MRYFMDIRAALRPFAILIAAAGVLAACAPPPGGYQGQQASAPPPQERMDWRQMSGFYCFTMNGQAMTNEITFVSSEEIVAAPVNRAGRTVVYQVGQRGYYYTNLGPSTYRFLSPTEVEWRSNKSDNVRLVLTRC